ncbi:MAG TPA: uracil-DNA glycosylase [Vicinamibacterales bacterium]
MAKVTPLDLVHERIVACVACDRLRTYCARVAAEKKAAHRADVYWGRPVPGFGDPAARLLVLGLAPAAHGANRTGRVFTGDGSGDFLMRAMHREGFATIPTSQRADDGLMLKGAYIAAAVRCAPPANKPTPEEIAACHAHLVAEVAALPHIRTIVCLGKIAFDAAWRLLASRGIIVRPRPLFVHGAVYATDGPTIIASYHPSRQNTNTRKLTPAMLASVFRAARRDVLSG